MSDYPHHESLRLQNFTAFADASFEFVPGINVFVGENGTGKTHAMKAMYAWQLSQRNRNAQRTGFVGTLLRTVPADAAESLVRSGAPTIVGKVTGRFGGEDWNGSFLSLPAGQLPSGHSFRPRVQIPVFIPAVDMMGHTKGFVSTYDLYDIDFDLTYREIVSLLIAPQARETDRFQQKLIAEIEGALEGQLELEDERFYLNTEKGRFSMNAIAEGLRKIATLLRLIQGGWLRPGATLFWDEPEVNLNPVLMDEVVGTLLALARSGVQIFLATHSYVILKELDLQAREDEVRYFAFKPGDQGTTVTYAADFALLDPNPILEQYDSLFSRDIEKTVNGGR